MEESANPVNNLYLFENNSRTIHQKWVKLTELEMRPWPPCAVTYTCNCNVCNGEKCGGIRVLDNTRKEAKTSLQSVQITNTRLCVCAKKRFNCLIANGADLGASKP